jgi:anti-sigma B factor antagonist
MSSAGLRLMLSLYRQISAGKGEIALVGMANELQDTMQATGFLRYFTLHASVDEAVAALQ